jgi:hypothetical protein
MKIGIVSDSHGKASRLRAAVALLAERGGEAVVHCGDVGSEQCIEALGAAGLPAYAVLGNVDRRASRLAAAARRCGVSLEPDVAAVAIGDGRHLAATHGHDDRTLAELIAGEQFAYVCHGHTHRARDERSGPVRVINPGALRHPRRPRRPTAALLNAEADTVEFLDVPT